MDYLPMILSGHDDYKPSLYELLAEQELNPLLASSARYLLALLTHRYPRYLLRIFNSFDELWALLSAVVEYHFLRTYSGSFTEIFYGLKRERALPVRRGRLIRSQAAVPSLHRKIVGLSRLDLWKNVLSIVGLQYVKRKLDESYELYSARSQVLVSGRTTSPQGPEAQGTGSRRKAELIKKIRKYYEWFVLRLYPTINLAHHLSCLAFNFSYLFHQGQYYSPILWLIGTRVRSMGPEDMLAIKNTQAAFGKFHSVSRDDMRRGDMLRLIYNKVLVYILSGLRLVLPASIFALKFIRWWHDSGFTSLLSRRLNEDLEMPTPVLSRNIRMKVDQRDSKVERGMTKAARDSSRLGPSGQSPEISEKSLITSDSRSDPSAEGGHTRDSRAGCPRVRTPISSSSRLPVLTVPPPTDETSSNCPICCKAISNATAAPSGYVYCYKCIFQWVEGKDIRQTDFMNSLNIRGKASNRNNRWESGKGRCAVTGMKILGGTDDLRRVIV